MIKSFSSSSFTRCRSSASILREMAFSARERSKSSPKQDKRYKMVLIGETGAGKTSFVELLLNFAKQFGMENFDLDKVTSFVKSGAIVTEKKSWESDTTQSKKYEADFGEFMLDIIDTPGFADTRGEDQRKENIANIINKVKEELYVNSVCLIVSGTQVRLTSVMKEVLTEIVSILPPDVLRNIIVVFTKTRDKFSLKFDLKVLKEEFQLSVPRDFIFMLDNPYTRLQTVQECGDELDEDTKDILSSDFATVHKMLEKFFTVTKRLKPALTLKFGEFHDAVQDIETSLAILRVIYENKSKVDKLMIETDLNKVKKFQYEKTSVTTSDSHHMVCTKSGCNSNCHKNCDCFFSFLHPCLCLKIGSSIMLTQECKICSHSSFYHQKVGYYYDTVQYEILVPDHEKKQCLEQEMASYDKQVSEESRTLESKLKKFQSVGSNGFFSENAKKHIHYLKKEIEIIPGTEWKKPINGMLNATLEVLEDPLTAKNEDAKFRWACGILGVDPDNVTREEVSKLFREQAQRFHPDASKDEATSGWFKHLNHAKEFITNKLLK